MTSSLTRWRPLRGAALLVFIAACNNSCGGSQPAADDAVDQVPATAASAEDPDEAAAETGDGPGPAEPVPEGLAAAVFAGGCFWCMEGPFERLDGVGAVESGYAGGRIRSPSYEQVSSGRTEHAEAVRVLYDPEVISYEELLEVYWHNVDPLDGGGQFCDRGSQYRPAIFPRTPEQRRLAEESIARVARELGRPVAAGIEEADTFWLAEEYHQDFYRTNPRRYQSYRQGCGRDARLEELWGEEAGH